MWTHKTTTIVQPNIIDYSLATGTQSDILVKEVQNKLKQGWCLYGSLVFSSGFYTQTMVKFNQEEQEEQEEEIK